MQLPQEIQKLLRENSPYCIRDTHGRTPVNLQSATTTRKKQPIPNANTPSMAVHLYFSAKKNCKKNISSKSSSSEKFNSYECKTAEAHARRPYIAERSLLLHQSPARGQYHGAMPTFPACKSPVSPATSSAITTGRQPILHT